MTSHLLLFTLAGCLGAAAETPASLPSAEVLADAGGPAVDAAPSPALAGTPVSRAFPLPPGTERVPTDAFGDWLRTLPLRAEGTPVLTHDGRRVGHRARPIELPMVEGDLQQCADAILRVRAEWEKEQGLPVSFQATNGAHLPWDRYRRGDRPYLEDRQVRWRSTGVQGSWDGYLTAVFSWAGTLSLKAYETVPVDTPRAGDILVEGGSPGHAVVFLDVAQDEAGATWVLVGESYMPAQDFHLELGPDDGWWPLTEVGLALPHWPLERSMLRRFKD